MENKLFKIFALSCLSIISVQATSDTVDLQALPYPYNTLRVLLPFNGHGWYRNGTWMENLIKMNGVKTVVEVGSWLGASARHIVSLLPEDGMFYAVDTWKGCPVINAEAENVKILPTLYEQFLSNVVHSGLTHKIIPFRMTSQEAVEPLQEYAQSFDLVYIDAAHDTESVLKDLNSYFPFVQNEKGIICGDDWTWPSVRAAVLQFAQEHELTVYADYDFWFYAEEGQYRLCSFVDASDKVWQFPKQK